MGPTGVVGPSETRAALDPRRGSGGVPREERPEKAAALPVARDASIDRRRRPWRPRRRLVPRRHPSPPPNATSRGCRRRGWTRSPRPPRDGEPRRVSRALASRRGFHVRQRGGAPRRRPLPQDTPRQHVLPTSSVGSARRARGVRGARMAPRPVRRRRPRRGRRPPDRVRRRPDRSWLRLVAPSVRPVPARGFSHTHALSPDPTRR